MYAYIKITIVDTCLHTFVQIYRIYNSSRAKAKHIKFIKKRDGRGIRLNFYLANLSTNILKGTRHILGWGRRHYKIRDKNISCIWDASPHLCREMERFPFRTQKER